MRGKDWKAKDNNTGTRAIPHPYFQLLLEALFSLDFHRIAGRGNKSGLLSLHIVLEARTSCKYTRAAQQRGGEVRSKNTFASGVALLGKTSATTESSRLLTLTLCHTQSSLIVGS